MTVLLFTTQKGMEKLIMSVHKTSEECISEEKIEEVESFLISWIITN